MTPERACRHVGYTFNCPTCANARIREARAVPVSETDAAEKRGAMWGLVRNIMDECSGHRFGDAAYDIRLDHIYENASVVASWLGAVSETDAGDAACDLCAKGICSAHQGPPDVVRELAEAARAVLEMTRPPEDVLIDLAIALARFDETEGDKT